MCLQCGWKRYSRLIDSFLSKKEIRFLIAMNTKRSSIFAAPAMRQSLIPVMQLLSSEVRKAAGVRVS